MHCIHGSIFIVSFSQRQKGAAKSRAPWGQHALETWASQASRVLRGPCLCKPRLWLPDQEKRETIKTKKASCFLPLFDNYEAAKLFFHVSFDRKNSLISKPPQSSTELNHIALGLLRAAAGKCSDHGERLVSYKDEVIKALQGWNGE